MKKREPSRVPWSGDRRRSHLLTVLAAVAVFVGLSHAVFVHYAGRSELSGTDVRHIWMEGERINRGENPYARVLDGDMRNNDKYATHLPGFYLVAAAMERSGVEGFGEFVPIWRWVQELFYLALGLMITAFLYRKGGAPLAIVGSFLWFFSRWRLAVIPTAQLEPMAVFFLVAGWLLYERRPRPALVLFGVSLAIKQIAIFLVPLFLIREWMSHRGAGWKIAARRSTLSLAAMAAIPLTISLPFLLWSFEGFCKSILFSATRAPQDHLGGLARSADAMAGLTGLPARLPMLFLLGLVYALFWKRNLGWNIAGLLVMTIFVELNAVLFVQYFFWLGPFLLFVVADAWQTPTSSFYAEQRAQLP